MFKNKLSRLLSTAILMCLPLLAVAQRGGNVTAAGTVVDQTGIPVPGASVIEAGTANGAVTDMDGIFSLSVAEGATLQISCIGYVSVEVKAGPSLSVVLQEDNEMLEETVVIGYGVQKKSSLTGAISSVKSEDLENRTITTIQEGLQGKTAGVQFVSTGADPGASGSIRIRGISSNASTEPLYVVDGLRLSSIASIDPNDIESMEVLKDAASAAIYGAEAGNGVILITTKKGSKGKGHIAYDFQYTIQSLSRIPEVLNADQYKEYMLEGGILTEGQIASAWDGKTNTDWIAATFEPSHMQKHSLQASGGNDRGNYFISVGYLDNDGIVVGRNDTYNRLTGVINGEYKITDWLTVGSSSNIARTKRNNVSHNSSANNLVISALMYDPLTPVTVSTPTDIMVSNMDQGRQYLKDGNGNYYGVSPVQASATSPLVLTNATLYRSEGFEVSGNAYANITPIKGLVFTSRFGYRLNSSTSKTIEHPYYGSNSYHRDYMNYSQRDGSTIYYQWENFANYSKSWAKSTLTAMAGFSFQQNQTQYTQGDLTGNGEDALKGNTPNFYHISYYSPSATKDISGETLRTAKMSWFGRVGYEYDQRYMVQATLRADAADSSMLPLNNRWGYFPSVSAGWTISNEEFFSSLKNAVNNLKVRASWGQNGSLASLGNFDYDASIVSYYSYPLYSDGTTVLGHYPGTLGNDKLKWETSEQLDLGLDARFFNDRLSMSVDYFSKQTKDLLVSGVNPSLSVGGTLSPVNAGNVSNKGFEFELSWKDRIGDFNYSISGNLATLKNKVTYVDPSLDFIAGQTRGRTALTAFKEGYPVYFFRGYHFLGVDSETGNPIFEDINGNGSYDDGDLTYIGDAIPDLTYGITLTASYKGFDLLVFGNGSQGNEIYLRLDEQNSVGNKLKKVFYDDRWTASNKNASKPRVNCTNSSMYNNSSAMVYDGSYFKIKQIQLGYTLPANLLKKIMLNKVRMYCSLDDFFEFTSYPGYSPDAASDAVVGLGVDNGAYPGSKKVVFGLNIDF